MIVIQREGIWRPRFRQMLTFWARCAQITARSLYPMVGVLAQRQGVGLGGREFDLRPGAAACSDSGQVVHTHVPLSPNSII